MTPDRIGSDPPAPAPRGRDLTSWIAEERRLRATRLSRRLTDWVTEVRARSAALDSRLRDREAAR